ncbi:MAG: hypothetical protein JSU98_16580, partial [Gemmatimonadales bacterium]
MRRSARRGWGTIAIVGLLGLCLGTAAWAVPQDDPDLDRARGEAALAQARDHAEAGRWQSALDAFATALRFLPGNDEAQSGVEQAQAMLNQGSTIQSTEQEIQRRKQAAEVEFRDSMTRARELLAQGDYVNAEREVVTAEVRLNRARSLFRPSEYASMSAEARSLLDEIDQRSEQARLEELARVEQEKQDESRRREEELQDQRQRMINENLRRVRQLQLEMKYKEALQVIDEILFVDELNPAALALRDVLRRNVQLFDYVEIQRQKEYGLANLSVEVQNSLIPPQPNLTGPGMRSISGVLQYPEDWPQITYQRTGDVGFQQTAADRMVAQRLSDRTIPVDFSNNTFEQVIAFLQQVSGVNMYVDWKALEFIGIDRNDDVSLQLNEVTASTA